MDMLETVVRGAAVAVMILFAWAVIKLVAALFKWLRTRALRDTGRAAGALVQAGKRAGAEIKEGYRQSR